MSGNTTGGGVPSIRSINVRANVLAEWTIDQVRFRTEAIRYVVGIVLCVAAMGAVLPALESSRRGFLSAQAKQHAQLKELKIALADADAAKKIAEPRAAVASLRAQTSGYYNRMLGELYDVLDAAKSGMAFSSAKVEVRAGDIIVDCRADAENYDVAAAFAEQAGSSPNRVSSLASTRPSPLLGPSGISFEYIKRVATQ